MAGRILSLRRAASRWVVEAEASRRLGLCASTSRLAVIAMLGASASSLALPALARDFAVGNASDLARAINSANNGDTIIFTSDITLGSNLPALTKNVTIQGQGKTLSGRNVFRGFIVGDPYNAAATPIVTINNLIMVNAVARGGSGADASADRSGAGGGGAGLGGALLVLTGANVTATNVVFQTNSARGGNGGEAKGNLLFAGGGGGGGYLANGQVGPLGVGGHGGLGGGGDGGTNQRGALAQPGGFGGGGGGQGANRHFAERLAGGAGGFGGGGGGVGRNAPSPNAKGGFGGADANAQNGGGGAGLGGAVFVQQGGTLVLGGSLNIAGNAVQGGQSPASGAAHAFGSGLFLQGDGSFALAPGAGQTQTISDVIADQHGVGSSAGSWSLVKNGAGTTILTGVNAYSGATLVNGGILLLGSSTSLPAASAVTLNGGMLGPNADVTFVVNNAISLGPASGTGFFASAGSNLLLGGVVSGGQLIKSGIGDVTLTGRNTYSGGTLVNGGMLLLGSSTSLPAAGAVTLNGGMLGPSAGGTTVVNNPISLGSTSGTGFSASAGANLLLRGVVSGSQLIKSGAGDVTLTGANTFNGATIAQGVLRFNTDANLGAAGDIIINGGSVGSASTSPAGTAIDRSLVLLGNGGIDVGNGALTWSGPIAGAGQFVKGGLGGLMLTGVNTYSGGTKILAGPLTIGSDAALGKAGTGVDLAGGSLHVTGTYATSRPFTLASGGAPSFFDIDGAQTLTLNGPINGGALAKEGAGTLALGVVKNGYSNTLVNAGTLVGNSLSIGGNLAFANGAGTPRSVIFDQSASGRSRDGFPAFSGNITGDGSLMLRSGNLTLLGKNDYTGGTTIQADTSLTGNTFSLQGNIVNNGRLTFNQDFDGTFSRNLSEAGGAGALIKAGAGNVATTGANFTTVTNVNGGMLTVNGSLDSPVTAVNDSGTLTVNGQMTSQMVSVNAGGSMAVNGNLTSPFVTISPGGELQGHGNITGDVDDKGGAIEPGNSIGTLHIFGPLVMEPHSEYQVQINGNSSDLIQVSETATIESSTFEIERYNGVTSPVVPGKTYTILTTGGGLTVAEPTLAIADFPFIHFTLSEDGFNGYLTTSRSAERFAELASTPNEAAVANALDSATSTLAWRQVVGASTADARAAFSSLSNASIHATAAGVLTEQSHFLRDAVLERLRQDFPSSAGPAPADSVLSYSGDGLPTKKATAVAPPGSVYAVWAQGLGSWGSLSGNSNVGRTDDSIGGIISGVDVTLNRMWRLGFAGGYTRTNFSSTNAAASGSADSYHMALYGGWQGGPWALRGGGSFTWNDIDTARQITVVGLGGQQNASYADKTWQAFGEAAHNFTFGAAALEPFANLAYVHIEGGVNETGLAAMSGSTSFDTTYTTLGAHGAYALPGSFTARMTLGWQHAFGELSPITTLAFEPGAAFGLAGSPIARDALVTELGVDYAIGPAATIGLTYAGQYSGNANENSAKANFTLRF